EEATEEGGGARPGGHPRPCKVGGHRHSPEIARELAELAGNGGRSNLTFVPHLMPYDQGELVSCYVRTAEPLDAGRLLSLYEERYADEAFLELASQPPGVSGVRATNLRRGQGALVE